MIGSIGPVSTPTSYPTPIHKPVINAPTSTKPEAPGDDKGGADSDGDGK